MRRAAAVIILILIVLAAAIGGLIVFGAARWESRTRALHASMDSARVDAAGRAYDERQLDGLPVPVQRYLRSVLRNGQPLIASARFTQDGMFLVRETPERWAPFTAINRVTARRPAFHWDARIAWAPGLRVFVRDAYIAREGILRAAAYGIVPLMTQRGGPELAEGELMRFLAEAPWYPTVLLPGHGVTWEAIDDSSARATLTDGGTTVSLEFCFGADGLVAGIRSPARYRDVNGTLTPTPWQGRFRRYEVHSGIRIPTAGTIAWVGETGVMPYWRGRVTGVSYEFVVARAAVESRSPQSSRTTQ